MGMYWPFKARPSEDLGALRQKVADLEVDLRAMARDMIDLDRSVARWMKRTQRDTREAAESEGPPTQGARMPTPPPNLRGARKRIWQRLHGVHVDGAVTVADANGHAED